MRTITATFYVNDGTPTPGAAIAAEHLVTGLGRLGWELDEDLAKLTPANVSFRLLDESEAIWNWFQTQLVTGGGENLFPPWAVLAVDGVQRFLGIVDLAGVRRNLNTWEVEVPAQDWSILLRDISLDGAAWERPLPKVISARTGAGPWWAVRLPISGAGWIIILDQTASVQVDDILTITPGGTSHAAIEVIPPDPKKTNRYAVKLKDWTGPIGTGYLVTRQAASLSDQPYYTVMKSVNPDTEKTSAILLDTVDHLAPGDTLVAVGGAEFPLVDVDAESKEVVCSSQIRETLTVGDRLYMTDETRETLIWQDARDLMVRAAAPYEVDFSRLSAATLPHAVLTWVPLQRDGITLRGPRDIEPTLTDIRIFGPAGVSYKGTPDGWTLEAGKLFQVPWTSQLVAAPVRTMPDDSHSIAPAYGARNRAARLEYKYARPRTRQADGQALYPPIFDPPPTEWPGKVVCHDYVQFRRLVVTNPTTPGFASASTIAEQRWSGSAWSTATAVSWPVAGFRPCSVVPMIGTSATNGPVAPQGTALVALCQGATTTELQVIFAGAVLRKAITNTNLGGRLVTTPWGVWLVSPYGYGRVTVSGGAIQFTPVTVGGAETLLLPTTFAALDGDSVWCLMQSRTTTKEGEPQATVFLVNLKASPTPGEDPVIFAEKVTDGAPRIAMAVRAPSGTELYGILGSRVFQVSAAVPKTIERVRVVGMVGGELLEHIAQLLNAVVWPGPDGVLHIISRTQADAPSALSVDRVTVTQSRISENFFSVVRVTGANDDVYADAYGAVNGGRVLELNSHPCVWSEGGCFALATLYAQFFGQPRAKETHEWFHENPNTAPPWEALAPWAHITPTGATGGWILTGISEDLEKGEAEATLLKVAP